MKNKALLNEDITRRMMKLANIGPVNRENFMNEAYTDLEEQASPPKDDTGADRLVSPPRLPEPTTVPVDLGKKPKAPGPPPANEALGDEEGLGDEAEGTIAMPEMELTDEEAQAIISFADKLEAAMGDDMGDEDLEGIEDVEGFEEEGEEEPLEEHRRPRTKGFSVDLVDALTQRVAARLMEAQSREAQNRARKEQIAESVADRIMKRLES